MKLLVAAALALFAVQTHAENLSIAPITLSVIAGLDPAIHQRKSATDFRI